MSDQNKKQRITSLEDQISELEVVVSGNQQGLTIVGETVREVDKYVDELRTAVYETMAAELKGACEAIEDLKARVAKLEG